MSRRALLVLLAVVAGAGATAAPAQAEVVWLCHPGLSSDPCRGDLTATVVEPDGSERVETTPVAPRPGIDCFYVYPTVSEDSGRNSDKSIDPEMTAIATFQAQRYSQHCRVFAPVYRQQTLAALGAGGSSEALALAYSDVEEAFRAYLAQDNAGRGIVFVGHSQGTRMLRQLLRKEVDRDDRLRARTVSALLLGANVLVGRGSDRGGDFGNLPACRSADQLGCVVAWSTFNETPPSNSRYGRSPATDTSGAGLPAGPDFEVLCTNPASLAGNERRPVSTYLPSERFPGFIGALLVVMFGGPPPSADTPWIQPQDHYTARCETRQGATTLQLEPIAGARKLNPSPDPSWGLHLADANIAFGDLTALVGRQAAAYLGRREDVPRVGAKVDFVRGRGGCIRRGVVVTPSGRDRGRVTRLDVRVGTRRAGRDVRSPFRVVVGRKALGAGRAIRLVTRLRLSGRQEVTVTRSLRTCA